MSKQTSESIKQEIAGLTERRTGLAVELEKANHVNEEAQTELLATGSGDAMKASTVAHARASALQHAVTTLDETVTEKQHDLEVAETYEKQAGDRLRAAECFREIGESEMEWRQARIRVHEVLAKEAPLGAAAWNRRKQLWAEYARLAKVIGAAPLINRVDGVEELRFGPLIDQAFQWQDNFDHLGTRAERKAKIVERSEREKERQRRLDEEKAARELEASKTNQSGYTLIAADRNPQRAA